jgi:threonyl-tRNA synthetase
LSNEFNFENEAYRKTYWHTCSHILAQAVKRLYPDVKLGIGPAIDNGFYYDFDSAVSFTLEMLEGIEAEMKKICKEKLPMERFELPRSEALELMLNEPYKVELIENLPDHSTISFYKQGDFVDLCAGLHLDSTGRVKDNGIKLLSTAGAYWHGDSSRKMLQRIYGVSFPLKTELDEYLKQRAEALERDHNKLGRQLEIFTTVGFIGQGLPIMLPNGSRILQLLQRFVEDEEQKRGYQLLTCMPLMAKRELYKISGHWDHYRDSMFVFGDPNTWEDPSAEVLALRPMACPFQFMVYKNRGRSFRDLPIKYAETATMFRNEESGEMHGLIRIRQFTISEGHIMCRPDQVEQQFEECLDLIKFMLKTIGLDDSVSYCFSKWDENNKNKYIGSAEDWEKTQSSMRTILDQVGLEYTEVDGEAAFYGPKLDVQIRNVHGKEDTLCTIQIDFQLAERYEMFFIDSDGAQKRPIIIHRTSIGCYQRVLALLLEKFGGAFPTWLSPVQVRVMNITSNSESYCDEICNKLLSLGIRSEFDRRNEKIGKKIRDAQTEKVTYMLIIGDKEMESSVVSVRSRKEGELGQMPLDEFSAKIRREIDERVLNV